MLRLGCKELDTMSDYYNREETNNPIKNGQRNLTGIYINKIYKKKKKKKIYKQAPGTQKGAQHH